ncbi:hypothetical protein Bca4012_050822 [Brassica carinata]
MIWLRCCGTLLLPFLLYCRYSSFIKAEWNLHMLGQAHEWRKAEESLSSHFNILNRGGMDANENFSSQFSSAVSSSLDVFDVVDASLLTSIDHSLKLDNGAYAKINSMIIPCCEDFDRSQEWMNLCVQHPGKDQMTYQALSPLRNLESQHLRLAESASRWETVEAG